jgi:hypothetical protein
MNRVYSWTYKNDRRGHRHRCRCCNRIINEGEQVVMGVLPRTGRTIAVHEDPCASQRHSPQYTWREVFEE